MPDGSNAVPYFGLWITIISFSRREGITRTWSGVPVANIHDTASPRHRAVWTLCRNRRRFASRALDCRSKTFGIRECVAELCGELLWRFCWQCGFEFLALVLETIEEACMRSFTKALLCTPNPCSRLWPAG